MEYIKDFGQDDDDKTLMPHFIYCGEDYFKDEKIADFILKKMRKYEIQSSILTILRMLRLKLITKEKVKDAYKGKLENDEDWCRYEGSIHDDLESFFMSLQNENGIEVDECSYCQTELKKRTVLSFFTPKLTNKQLKLVQERNEKHMNTYFNNYWDEENTDVDVEEMTKSDSKAKFVHGSCFRITIPLTGEATEIEDEVPDAKRRKTHA